MTYYYNHLCGNGDRDINRTFTSIIGGDMTYYVRYGDCGSGCHSDSVTAHTCKDSWLMYSDAEGLHSFLLGDNNRGAQYAENLRFSNNCPFTLIRGKIFFALFVL